MTSANAQVRIGLIGCGHWGPNHLRNFSALDGVTMVACADLDSARLEFVRRSHPEVRVTRDYHDLLDDDSINTIIVATTASSHYAIVRQCLERGKDVVCEKPLTQKLSEASELVELADRQGRLLMVGHTFLFNRGIQRLREYLAESFFGGIRYMHSVRTNLGPIRQDTNVVWDLAAHDVSIFSFLLDRHPIGVTARGEKYLQTAIEDVAFITLTYPPNILVNIHVSWMHPQKTRQITIVGDKKMVTWDDLNPLEPIKIYDKGVIHEPYYETYGEFNLLLREGDILSPKVNLVEPLKVQSQHFVDCLVNRKKSISDGAFGAQMVRVLEGIQRSMDQGGAPQEIGSA